MFTRRELLAGLGAAALLLPARRARALGDGSAFRFGHLRVSGGNWNPRPLALKQMTQEVWKRTSIDVPRDYQPRAVAATDDGLHETPFLYLAGDREFDLPNPAGVQALRRFLTFGGFLLIDSAEGSTDGAFDGSVRQLVQALFPPPEAGLTLVPRDHVAYHSFYLLDRPLGRLAIAPAMEGVVRDGRLVVAYVQNDLGGAWARDDLGNPSFQCVPGGERQREMAYRVGVNLVMYSLCLDYKTDQVHVPFIMRRRRWRPDDGGEAP